MGKSRLALGAILAVAACMAAAPSLASFHGRNGQIVFRRGGDIWGIGPTGKGLHRVTHFVGQEDEPHVSPNGRQLAFEHTNPGETAEIYTSTTRGKHPRWITKKMSRSGKWLSFHGPAWSPNGKRIAFECDRYEFHGICTISKRGGKPKVLYRCGNGNCNPSEPDWGRGNRIVFVNGLKLFVVSGSGHGKAHRLPIKKLNQYDTYYEHPSFKPNGKTIAFQVNDTNTAIDVVNVNGTHHKRLAWSSDFSTDRTDYNLPAWSPNGRKIALQVEGPSGSKPHGIYTMNANGSGLKKISSQGLDQHAALFWATK